MTVSLLGAVGCSSAGVEDAGTLVDAARADAGLPRADASPIDTGAVTPDAESPDRGVLPEDTGVVAEDTGVVAEDTGVVAEDTGVSPSDSGVAADDAAVAPDAEPQDVGTVFPDATFPDAALVDSGPADTGVTTGTLQIDCSGAPNNFCSGSVNGPGGFSRSFFGSPTVISFLMPGVYDVTSGDIQTAGETFVARVSGSPATVTAGQTAHVQVTYTAPLPIITAVVPAAVRAGGTTTIQGQHLWGTVTVRFGNQTAAELSHFSNQSITVTAPPHATGTATVTVSTLSGTATRAPPLTIDYYDVTSFTLPSGGSGPAEITQGSDGNYWFTERSGNRIGRITPAGVVTEFVITAGADLVGITAGSDGNVWFAESGRNTIGRITPAGVITEFTLPTTGVGARNPFLLTLGGDGNVWFTSVGNANSIGRMTPAGVLTEFSSPTAGSLPFGIGLGPDGNVWFGEYNTGKIARVTPAGVITEFTARGGIARIVAGPNDTVWFNEDNWGTLGSMNTVGAPVIVHHNLPYGLPSQASGAGLVQGPDGSIWYSSANVGIGGGGIIRITPNGDSVPYPFPNGQVPGALYAHPGGHELWYTSYGSNAVGRVQY